MKDLIKFNLIGGETLVLSPKSIVGYYKCDITSDTIIEVGSTPLTHTVRESVQEINHILREVKR
tara:strand:+ start:1380 stop:1571 length:192 start_codon:yes stop_codon:yes gene_type:complete